MLGCLIWSFVNKREGLKLLEKPNWLKLERNFDPKSFIVFPFEQNRRTIWFHEILRYIGNKQTSTKNLILG